jgi:L-threonylcarbamoyladenylate synthase
MTLILKRSKLAKDFITGGQENVGLRVPNQPVALSLLSEFELLGGLGIAAPSANRFGAVSPTSSDAVADELSQNLQSNDLILNGGLCQVGIESTIVNCLGDSPLILRPGAITLEMISALLGIKNLHQNPIVEVKVSGNQNKHYAPKANILINTEPKKGEGLIALDIIKTPVGVKRLLAPSNSKEFAEGLYGAFRLGDKLNLTVINIYVPEHIGLGVAINDRIKKASYKRNP